MLREEYRQSVAEGRLVRRIYGTKKKWLQELQGNYNEQLHEF
jgi:hypothetical protein